MIELTIDDLLNSLQNPSQSKKTLENNADTWRRIANKDSFSELELPSSELESFLKEWISNNPYSSF